MRRKALICTAALLFFLCSCAQSSVSSSVTSAVPSENTSAAEAAKGNSEQVPEKDGTEVALTEEEQNTAVTEDLVTEKDTETDIEITAETEPESEVNSEVDDGQPMENADETTEESEPATEAEADLLEYSASGKGAVGKIIVTIWVQDGVLVDCQIDASKESEDKGGVVAAEYQAAIMSGTLVDDLDSVEGASMSSATIKKLLRKCFKEAGIEH